MSQFFSNNIRPGKAGIISDASQLGQTAYLEDLNYASTEGILPKLSGAKIEARIVANVSGGALSPGAVAKHATSSYGPFLAVGGEAGASDYPAGIVDPWLTADVADGEFFLLFVRGPAKMLSTTGTAIAVGDKLINGAAARAVKYSSITADDNLQWCAQALEAVASGAADDTKFRVWAHFLR